MFDAWQEKTYIKSSASINEAIIIISVIRNIVGERIKRAKREENKYETQEVINLGYDCNKI